MLHVNIQILYITKYIALEHVIIKNMRLLCLTNFKNVLSFLTSCITKIVLLGHSFVLS